MTKMIEMILVAKMRQNNLKSQYFCEHSFDFQKQKPKQYVI